VPTILLVEDDRFLAEGLEYNLERAGHRVVRAGDATAGLRLVRDAAPDLVVLDLMLPGVDGFGFLARLRAAKCRAPVIVLSALESETDKIRALDAGADDFVTKPFGVGELLARIRARLSSPERGARREAVQLPEGTIDLGALEFRSGRRRVTLTPTEAALLDCLLRAEGAAVPREHLLRAVWGVGSAESRTLDTHVARLRRKIEPDPDRPRYLRTAHSVGYRFVSDARAP
jgi:DNA-binding response OmpR family regulator